MCNHSPDREAAMIIIPGYEGTPERKFRDGVWCDPCLVPIIKALNDGGLPTISSCCGHGSYVSSIALADGRWVLVLPDMETFQAMDTKLPNISDYERKVLANPELVGALDAALEQVENVQRIVAQGLAESAAGKTVSLGDFTQYVADDGTTVVLSDTEEEQ